MLVPLDDVTQRKFDRDIENVLNFSACDISRDYYPAQHVMNQILG